MRTIKYINHPIDLESKFRLGKLVLIVKYCTLDNSLSKDGNIVMGQ